MTCQVLHAGDGYAYLTQQVASGDVLRGPHDPLVGYYTVQGYPPGRWVDSGCADVGMFGQVSEEHMLALFGEGLRPDATEFIAARIGEGRSFAEAYREARLGRRFARYGNEVPLVAALHDAYDHFEERHRRRPTVDERRDIKMATARTVMALQYPGRPVPGRDAVRRFIATELGKARQPVAGFDLVFSPVKSVSVVWALGGPVIRAQIEAIHEYAWRTALAYGEREAAFTRTGAGGIAFQPTRGFVATAFDHRDSRAGDPDLHTHVAVSNRVLTTVDGKWRTVDGQQLFTVAVSMSECYNAVVEQETSRLLGARFTEVPKGLGTRVVREIEGLPGAWLAGFSRRAEQVEHTYERLVAEYVREYGRTPPRAVQYDLVQQAALTDRPEKESLRTLAEQVAQWRGRARGMLPDRDVDAVIAACLGHRVDPVEVDVAAVAAAVIDVVCEHRATWTVVSRARRGAAPATRRAL